MRAFVAIPLPAEMRQTVMTLQEDLGQGRPVIHDNLHVTLAFLDEQTDEMLENLHDALSEIVAGDVPLLLNGVEARGGRAPSLVWAALDAAPELANLRARVRSAAHRTGMTLPRARFRPHVTLARFRRGDVDTARLAAWLGRHGAFRCGPMHADGFALYRSTLGPDGPVYDVLADYPVPT
ncbi:MAG: RNA 2',3'-cyclic phosphodiesterase [Pseudomonadota bacterium]